VGRSKAEVAAARIMERISGVTVTPHHCMIQEKTLDFYKVFHVIVLGLDSVEARRYMNSVACSFLGGCEGGRAGGLGRCLMYMHASCGLSL
jgi:NEDD8-activating enzyme E1